MDLEVSEQPAEVEAEGGIIILIRVGMREEAAEGSTSTNNRDKVEGWGINLTLKGKITQGELAAIMGTIMSTRGEAIRQGRGTGSTGEEDQGIIPDKVILTNRQATAKATSRGGTNTTEINSQTEEGTKSMTTIKDINKEQTHPKGSSGPKMSKEKAKKWKANNLGIVLVILKTQFKTPQLKTTKTIPKKVWRESLKLRKIMI